MAQQPLNYGSSVEDGTGDPLRVIFAKISGNLSDLDGRLSASTALIGTLGGAARLNVGTATGTVADGGALTAETTRATAAEQANTNLITAEASRAQSAEALKAPIASPSFTGVPTAPTATAGTGTTQIATTAFVATAVAAGGGGGGGGVPTTRQILSGGLATGGGDLTADRTITVPKAAQSDVAAGTDDAKALTSFSIAARLGALAPLASPAFVGTPTVPTATAGTSTTQAASTAFVAASFLTASTAAATYAPLASPAFTGSPTVPTQAAADNSTKAASTAYADRAATNAVSAVPSAPPVRQTAISGPAASGAPSFLPATSGSLTLAGQNVSASVPLIVTAAQGGLNNAVFTFTSNPSWTLTASATNFLFANASTGATSVSTLAPIYQFGGTPSTANGQFTFDWQAMVGYLGNGTTAVATPLVCLGEAVASASAVTSTIAYAYQGRYQSGAVVYAAGTGNYAFSHNIGVPIEFLQIEPYARSPSNTGAWTPNAMAVGSAPYPMAGLLGGVSRLTIKLQPGGSGPYYDTGTQTGATATSGDLMVRVRRAF